MSLTRSENNSTVEKKRRNVDPLGERAHEQRTKKKKLEDSCYGLNGSLSLSKRVQPPSTARYRKALCRTLNERSRAKVHVGLKKNLEKALELPSPIEKNITAKRMTMGGKTRRRESIWHFFHDVYGMPPEKEWKRVISLISKQLGIPVGSRNTVRNVIQQGLASINAGSKFQADAGLKSRKTGKFIIKKDSVESELVADCLQNGLSITQATVKVNLFRSKLDPPLPATNKLVCGRKLVKIMPFCH